MLGQLRSRRFDDPALAGWLPTALLQELRCEGTLMLSMELTNGGPIVSDLPTSGALDLAQARRQLERLLSQAWQRSQQSAILRPSVGSAGVVRTTGDFSGLGEDAERLRECFNAIGAAGKHTLRACVADEQGTLLAAFLCFRPEAFEHREVDLFNELIPRIRAKAIFEKQVEGSTLAWEGLKAALAALRRDYPTQSAIAKALPVLSR